MQPETQMTDLLELALEEIALRHRHEREMLVDRAEEFVRMQETMQAIGLRVTSMALHPICMQGSDDVVLFADAASSQRGEVIARARAAGLRVVLDKPDCHSALLEHTLEHWVLFVQFMPAQALRQMAEQDVPQLECETMETTA